MHEKLIELKCKLAQDNNIFGDNAYYLKDILEFSEKGIDDSLVNMFYIRPVNLDTSKFSIIGNYKMYSKKARFRLVVQLTKKINKETALKSFLNQLMHNKDITIISYSDDNNGIYKTERKEDMILENSNLISYDFDFSYEFAPGVCNCLTIENCPS